MPRWTRTPGLGAIHELEAGKELPIGPTERGHTGRRWDYTHLLPDELRAKGFKIIVDLTKDVPGQGSRLYTFLRAFATHPRVRKSKLTGDSVGGILGAVSEDGDTIYVDESMLLEKYRGLGIGKALYSALYRQAQLLGVKRVTGGVHSTMAMFVLKSLAKTHGLKYDPEPSYQAVDDQEDVDAGKEWYELDPSKWVVDNRWDEYEFQLNGTMRRR